LNGEGGMGPLSSNENVRIQSIEKQRLQRGRCLFLS